MTLLSRWWIIIASGRRLHLPQMLQSFFQNYRASSHATTGVSVFEQFEMLRGRKICKKLKTLSATTHQGEEVAMGIRDSVQKIQQKMKKC